jgi:6-phospho-beta-glucosidase
MNRSISIIGAGSNYTPVIVNSLLDCPGEFLFDRLVLADTSPKRLDIISKHVTSQLQNRGVGAHVVPVHLRTDDAGADVVSSSSLHTTLEDVDAVLTLYRIGGLDARHADTRLAIEYGVLGQETIGWGGFASALRNIPMARQISEVLTEVAPDCWLVNITNPVGIITRVCCKAKPNRTLGICEIPVRMLHAVSEVAARPIDRLDVRYIGLNHLSWITEVWDRDSNESVLDSLMDGLIERVLRIAQEPNIQGGKSLVGMAKSLHAIPSPYLSYYYGPEEMRRRIENATQTRAEVCMDIDKRLMTLYEQLDAKEWSDPASSRGGYLLGPTIASLVRELLAPTGRTPLFPCVMNKGLSGEMPCPFLPADAVVEVNATREGGSWKTGLHDDVHPHIRGLMAQIASYEEMTAEAGTSGDRGTALAALVTHPLIQSWPVAEKLLDATLLRNREYLPQFR